MVWLQYAATRRQRAATAGLFLTGAALIVAAARLSYANVEPQRAKAAERRKVLEEFIARKRAAVGGAGTSRSQPDPPIKTS
jgi:peptidoglycan/LPS O-acetylase OafA/YrhL